MNINRIQIISLWEKRISTYVHKKGIKTRKILPILGIFIFVISGNAQF